jgi:hypothetical protein
LDRLGALIARLRDVIGACPSTEFADCMMDNIAILLDSLEDQADCEVAGRKLDLRARRLAAMKQSRRQDRTKSRKA